MVSCMRLGASGLRYRNAFVAVKRRDVRNQNPKINMLLRRYKEL